MIEDEIKENEEMISDLWYIRNCYLNMKFEEEFYSKLRKIGLIQEEMNKFYLNCKDEMNKFFKDEENEDLDEFLELNGIHMSDLIQIMLIAPVYLSLNTFKLKIHGDLINFEERKEIEIELIEYNESLIEFRKMIRTQHQFIIKNFEKEWKRILYANFNLALSSIELINELNQEFVLHKLIQIILNLNRIYLIHEHFEIIKDLNIEIYSYSKPNMLNMMMHALNSILENESQLSLEINQFGSFIRKSQHFNKILIGGDIELPVSTKNKFIIGLIDYLDSKKYNNGILIFFNNKEPYLLKLKKIDGKYSLVVHSLNNTENDNLSCQILLLNFFKDQVLTFNDLGRTEEYQEEYEKDLKFDDPKEKRDEIKAMNWVERMDY